MREHAVCRVPDSQPTVTQLKCDASCLQPRRDGRIHRGRLNPRLFFLRVTGESVLSQAQDMPEGRRGGTRAGSMTPTRPLVPGEASIMSMAEASGSTWPLQTAWGTYTWPSTQHSLNSMLFSVRVPVLSVNTYSTCRRGCAARLPPRGSDPHTAPSPRHAPPSSVQDGSWLSRPLGRSRQRRAQAPSWQPGAAQPGGCELSLCQRLKLSHSARPDSDDPGPRGLKRRLGELRAHCRFTPTQALRTRNQPCLERPRVSRCRRVNVTSLPNLSTQKHPHCHTNKGKPLCCRLLGVSHICSGMAASPSEHPGGLPAG